MIIGWSLSSSGLELDVAGHGCGVAVELGRLRGVSSSVPARGSDCVSQDPSHDGVDKSGVDKGDVVEVRLVPEFEGWRLLGVYALCVCVDSSGCAVGLVVGDFFYQLFNDTYYLLLSSYDFIISCLPSFVTRFIYFIISNIIMQDLLLEN